MAKLALYWDKKHLVLVNFERRKVKVTLYGKLKNFILQQKGKKNIKTREGSNT